MAKPVLVVVDGEDASLRALTGELEARYGVHYEVASCSSAEVALARLAELKAAGVEVPLVLADQQPPGMSGIQLLARVREIFPTARRGLLISWGDRSGPAPFLEAAALGQLEFYLAKPTWSPDEQFHRVVTGSLEEWWREQGGQGGQGELVTVIADDPSARIHEIRDLLARNNVPFCFYPSDSPEGQAAMRRLGVGHPAPALPRSIVKLQYAATRLPFTLFEDFVVARYWDQDAPARVGFERWLGSLDLLAGRLLADDQISRPGPRADAAIRVPTPCRQARQGRVGTADPRPEDPDVSTPRDPAGRRPVPREA